jgi:hypothetical protein
LLSGRRFPFHPGYPVRTLLSVAILTPEALFLTARGGFAGIEAQFVSLGLLDGAYQFGLFHLSGLDMVLFRYFPDLIQFHIAFSPLFALSLPMRC